MARDNVKVTKTIKFIESKMGGSEDEEIMFSILGNKDGQLAELVGTPKRYIIGSKSFFSGESYEEVYYEQMDSVDYKESFKSANLKVYLRDSSRVFEFDSADKEGLRLLREDIKEILDRNMKIKVDESKDNSSDYITELERLAKLKEEGHLSGEEFEALKRKLLV